MSGLCLLTAAPVSCLLCLCLQGRYIMEATKHIPVIGDGDTGLTSKRHMHAQHGWSATGAS